VQRIKGENEMKTSELKDLALDWAVCEATGMFKAYTQFRSGKNFLKVYGVARNKHLHPSTDWAQGGPIIEREGISTAKLEETLPDAMAPHPACWSGHIDGAFVRYGPTPLIAAMRCLVASRLGADVDVPKDLT
jgi:hypothetical protein